MYAVSTQWASTIVSSHAVANTVEVWAGGNLIGYLPFESGSVSEQWVTGPRRTLQLTVPPTPVAKALLYPGVELRPMSGVNYGSGPPELLPMGRFPVESTAIGIRPDTKISLSCQDRWQWVTMSTFSSPYPADVSLTIPQQIVRLLVDTGQWSAGQITNTTTSTVKVAAQVWDTDRNQAIADLATSIGAEVFIDRVGNPVIQHRPTLGASVATFTPAVLLKDVVATVSSSAVYNAVRVASSNTDPAFITPAWTARITDPKHPAYPRPGQPIHVLQVISAQYTTQVQMKNAAEKMLSKVSRQARQLAIVAAATDPSLDAADAVTVVWPSGVSETQHIDSVSHSLTVQGSDAQQITTSSNRSDEDFTP